MEFNPYAHLEKLELDKKNTDLDDSKKVSSKDLEKAKIDAQKIFGGNYNEDKIYDIPQIDETKATNDALSEYFNIPKKIPENQLDKKVKNNKYTPIINRLQESGQISLISANKIKKQLDTNKKINTTNLDIPQNEKENINGFLNNFEFSENNKNQNLTELIKDTKKIIALKDYNIKTNPDGTFENEILNKIGKNYLKIPEIDGNYEIEKDLSTAIKTTKNEIISKVKNLPIDSETYKVSIKNIESNDLKQQLKGINNLYILAYSHEGELGKTTLDKYKNQRKKELISEFKKLNKEFDILSINKTTEKINQRKKEINQRITSIGNEANEIEDGDIFEAGELDQKDESKIEKDKR